MLHKIIYYRCENLLTYQTKNSLLWISELMHSCYVLGILYLLTLGVFGNVFFLENVGK